MSITTKTGILAEALNRKTKVQANPVQLAGDFPQQNSFINDPNRFIDAQCSRRAGKTNALALKFFKTMEANPKTKCAYLTLTLVSARNILWPVLNEINDKFKIGCSFLESRLTVKHPNGSTLQLYGADQKNFNKRIKGQKFIGVGVDEAQDFSTHLQSLIDDVLTPSIADYPNSWVALTGTPGAVPKGYFYEVTKEKRYGYSHHEWTMFENPFMPNPKGFLKDLMIKRGWDETNPTLLREYRNQWVLDIESLWIRYNEKNNHYDELPKNIKFNYVMGVDIGFRDADAIAILAWSEDHPVTYLVEERLTRKQDLTSLLAQVQELEKKYQVVKIVMDEGGLGKKLAEELRRRHGVPINPADKVRKQENVELLNDSMRLGKFKAKKDSAFAKDSYLIEIDWDHSTPNRIVTKKSYHSDIIDAVLYGFKETYAYANQVPAQNKPHYGSKEWADQQTDEMWERELEGYQKAEELKKEYFGE